MSTLLSEKNGVRTRKKLRCCLCSEAVLPGELRDIRTGANEDGIWTMHMHPECHAYELLPGIVDPDWYEDSSEPAFTRAEAIAAQSQPLS